jgi:hypothetical protein
LKNYKKFGLSSILAFIIGTSCCWISAVAFWIGGVAILGGVASFIESIQLQVLLGGIVLAMLSFYLYIKNRKQLGNVQQKH